jgi:pimeloyl-ACP methyl ester carboxylesterase
VQIETGAQPAGRVLEGLLARGASRFGLARRGVKRRRPALVRQAASDPFRNHELFRDVAERAHTRTVELDGLGHWWMLQDPGRGARELEGFWDSLA